MEVCEVSKGSHFAGLERFCDGRIRTEDGCEFPIHCVILSSRSDYFRALFSSDISGRPEKDVLIRDLSGSTMSTILNYLYTGTINLNSENICNLLVASDYFRMDALMAECRASVAEMISPLNCIDLFNLGLKIENLGIFNVCYRYIQTNFSSVMSHSDVEELPLYSLALLLTDNNINVEEEESVWNAIVKWVSGSPSDRYTVVPTLLLCLRYDDMAEKSIKSILDHPYVLENEFCSQLLSLTSNISEGSLKDRFIEAATELATLPVCFERRQPFKRHFFVKYFHSPRHLSDGVKAYITYDEHVDRWWRVQRKLGFSPESLFAIGQIVWMLDSWEGISYGLDILQKTWIDMAFMNEPRREYNTVRIDNYIYSIGGVIDNIGFIPRPTVERFDSDLNHWTVVSPMLVPARGASEALNGFIYTLGDYFDPAVNDFVMVGQAYDPQGDSWTLISRPAVYRRHFAMVAYEGKILVIGGNDYRLYLKTVDSYDPSEDVWTSFKELPVKYYLPKAVVLNGILIVYDNHSDDRKYYKTSPSVYWDQDQGEWQTVDVSSNINELYRCQFCAIEDPEVNRELRSMMNTAKWSTPFRKRLFEPIVQV